MGRAIGRPVLRHHHARRTDATEKIQRQKGAWMAAISILPAKKIDGLEKIDGLGFVGFCGEIASLDLKRAYPVVFGCYCYRNHCDFWLPQ
jgi:hypothetical protein